MKNDIENIKQQVLIKWLKSQTEYVGDYNGEYNLDSVCLDGWFNLEELSSLIADEVLKVVVEKINKVHNEEIEEINNSNNQELTKKYIITGLEVYKDSLLSNLSPNKENKNNE